MLLLIGVAFLSGLVTVLLPCILPILPIVLAGGVQRGRLRPLGIMVGIVISFTFFALALAAITRSFDVSPDDLRLVAIVMVGLIGVLFLIPGSLDRIEARVSRLTGKLGGQLSANQERKGFFGGLLLGATLGLIWTPCVGPVLAAVTSIAATQSVDAGLVAVVFAYALGVGLPIFAIAYGGQRLTERVTALRTHLGTIQQVFGGLLVLVAVGMAFGLDRDLQTVILDTFPDYQEQLQFFEDSDKVQQQLDELEQ